MDASPYDSLEQTGDDRTVAAPPPDLGGGDAAAASASGGGGDYKAMTDSSNDDDGVAAAQSFATVVRFAPDPTTAAARSATSNPTVGAGSRPNPTVLDQSSDPINGYLVPKQFGSTYTTKYRVGVVDDSHFDSTKSDDATAAAIAAANARNEQELKAKLIISATDANLPKYQRLWPIFLHIAPTAFSVFFTVFGSVLLSAFFTYLTPVENENDTGGGGMRLDLIVFYVRLGSDMLARFVCIAFPRAFHKQWVVTTLSVLRNVIFIPFFFWYILNAREPGSSPVHSSTYRDQMSERCGCSAADDCLFVCSLFAADFGITLGVAIFSFLSGLLVTGSFQLAPTLLHATHKSDVSNIMNVAFQSSILMALITGFVLKFTLLAGLK